MNLKAGQLAAGGWILTVCFENTPSWVGLVGGYAGPAVTTASGLCCKDTVEDSSGGYAPPDDRYRQ